MDTHDWISLTYFKLLDGDWGWEPYHGGFFCTSEQAMADYHLLQRKDPDIVGFQLTTIPYFGSGQAERSKKEAALGAYRDACAARKEAFKSYEDARNACHEAFKACEEAQQT